MTFQATNISRGNFLGVIREVTCRRVTLSILSRKRDQINMRDNIDRRGDTPHKRVTSPTWGLPPPCKQALNLWREPALGCWPPCSQGPLFSSLKNKEKRRQDIGKEVVTWGEEEHKLGTRFSVGNAGSQWERKKDLEKASTRENQERKRLTEAIFTRVYFSFWD